jgi:two-component sensor histidine kinase
VPIVLTAYFGDTKAALLATLISVAAGSYWSFPPIGSFRVDDVADEIRLGAFLIVAAGIGWLTARVARFNRQLQEAVKDLRQAQDHLQLLLRELGHRVRNMLATIESISFQTARHSRSLPEFQKAFSDRIRALANMQDILSAAHWSAVQVRELIMAEISARMAEGQISIDGPDAPLAPLAALALHMVIHELCTNSVKYGALSNATGAISIVWSLEDRGNQAYFRLLWRESGGPPVELPTRQGFGSELLQQTIEYELGGTLELSFPRTGAMCELSFPYGDKHQPAEAPAPLTPAKQLVPT